MSPNPPHSAELTSPTDSTAYYRPLGDGRYLPTIHTEGAWVSHEQHMAPVSGLLTDAIEKCSGRSDLITSRIAFDILGLIGRQEVQITAQVIRPGRTIELVQAEMSDGDRTLVRATAWRLIKSDTAELAGCELPTMPGPDDASEFDATTVWGGGFISSVNFWVADGWRRGRGQAWLRTEHPLIEGEQCSELAAFVGLIDTANGIATRVPPEDLLFPNTDLTVHFIRAPRGRWVGLDTSVSFGPDGVGLTESVLHDEHGPVGRAAQSLTLRRR